MGTYFILGVLPWFYRNSGKLGSFKKKFDEFKIQVGN